MYSIVYNSYDAMLCLPISAACLSLPTYSPSAEEADLDNTQLTLDEDLPAHRGRVYPGLRAGQGVGFTAEVEVSRLSSLRTTSVPLICSALLLINYWCFSGVIDSASQQCGNIIAVPWPAITAVAAGDWCEWREARPTEDSWGHRQQPWSTPSLHTFTTHMLHLMRTQHKK